MQTLPVNDALRNTSPGESVSTSRWPLVGLSSCMLLSSLGTSIANVALPTLSHDWGASFQAVQWVVISYLLATTTLIVSAGRLGDILGRKRLLLIGIGVFITASILCGIAPQLWLLVTARVLQGAGAAIMMALSMAMVSDTVPKERTGSAMGLLGTMSAIGTALGPSLGGLLIWALGWRAIFLLNVPLGILALYLAQRHLQGNEPHPMQETRKHFDLRGTVWLALTLGIYALAMTVNKTHLGWLNLLLLSGSLVVGWIFLRSQRHAAMPLVKLSAFRDGALSASLLMSALVSTVMMATLVVGPFYLSLGLGLDTAMVGLAMSAGPLIAAVTGVPAGRLVDRYGSRRMTVMGLGGIVTGTMLLSALPVSCGVLGYILPITLATASYALFQAANNTTVMIGVSADRRGTLSGLLNLSRNLGLITGASFMGVVFARASGVSDINSALPDAVALAMRVTYAVAALLGLLALVVSTRKSPRPQMAD